MLPVQSYHYGTIDTQLLGLSIRSHRRGVSIDNFLTTIHLFLVGMHPSLFAILRKRTIKKFEESYECRYFLDFTHMIKKA